MAVDGAAYVFISAAQRDLLLGVGLTPERTFVRHNFIPRQPEPHGQREAAVVYAGRLDEAKGLRLLMAGWDRYAESASGTELRLDVVGAGPLDAEVSAWASTRPSVRFIGQVDRPRCVEIMSRARAVILPSAWEETFGLAAVEAMAVGAAPIAAGHGSFTELITQGVDGVLFSPGDPHALATAIADVAEHPERHEVYGEQARKTYEQRFNPEQSMDKLLRIYDYAISNPV